MEHRQYTDNISSVYNIFYQLLTVSFQVITNMRITKLKLYKLYLIVYKGTKYFKFTILYCIFCFVLVDADLV